MPEIPVVDLKSEENFQDHLLTIKKVLGRGGIIAFPTDTFYGLGVDPFQEQAVAEIFRTKNREPGKPVLVLAASMKQVESLAGEISREAKQLIREFWPGPLTLLFKSLPHLPGNLTAQTGKIGIRQPGNDLARKLMDGIGHPLTGTSANISGSENLRTADEVLDALGSKIDLIVDGGPAPGGKLSTILDTTVSPFAIIREGAVAKEKIESVLRKRCVSES